MSRGDTVGLIPAIGIMTGTSADGADAVLVTVERGPAPRRTRLLAMRSRPYPPELRSRVLRAQEGTLLMRDLLALHVELGRHAALLGRELMAASEARGITPEVVGLHGQTVFHDPRGLRAGVPLSIQIGEPAAVAQSLACPVVSSFRMADVLEGGEGAPLVPRFDWHQFASPSKDRALVNLGGIANLTRLRAGVGLPDLTAFDCGPGNMLLDGLMAAHAPEGPFYDVDGALAARGKASAAVVREFLADPYIRKRFPKSAGREEFGAAYLARFLEQTEGSGLEDRLRTAVEITAGAVAQGIALTGEPPQEVYVSGGGAMNRTLLSAVRAALPGAVVATTEALGVPVAAKEAMAFAFLAFETISGRPGNVPAATGARKEVVLGSITPPPRPR